MEKIQHMVPATKDYEVREWEKAKTGPRGEPGEGYPDTRILLLCDKINELPHICTLQSCAGHTRSSERRWASDAHLWLWFDEKRFHRFVVRACELAKQSYINEVALLYGRYPDNRVVASVHFQGDNVEPSLLENAGATIYTFLKGL